MHFQMPYPPAEASTYDINQAFIAVKLWFLLLHQLAAQSQSDSGFDLDTAEKQLWNQVWPPFERLVLLSTTLGEMEGMQVRYLSYMLETVAKTL